MVVTTSVDVSEGIGRAETCSAEAADGAGHETAEDGETDRGEHEREADRRSERDLGHGTLDGALAERSRPGQEARALVRGIGDSCLKRGRERGDGRSARQSEHDADGAPEEPLYEGLSGHLPDDEALRPAERLQRSELADALRDRGEREQARDEEGSEQPDD
jgi:hypothetical protein